MFGQLLGDQPNFFYACFTLANIILPAEVCNTLVTVTSTVSPTKRLPFSMTIIVPSSI